MADTDVDMAHSRRSQQDAESTTVDMTDIGTGSTNLASASVEYPNVFQQSEQRQYTPQQHYNLQIPTINHWPALLIQHTRKGIKFVHESIQHTRKGIRFVHESIQQLRNNSYRSVPSTDHTRRFGSRRLSKEAGHSSSCSSRRFNRILILLSLISLIMTWVLLPRTLDPFQNRDVWVRFFDHEDAVKVVLPYGRKVLVYDVKKNALKEMDNGYTSHNPADVKLLEPFSGRLLISDNVWDNGVYFSSARYPIIAIQTRFEMFDYLNRTLGCFSDISAFNNNVYEIKFQPPHEDYGPLFDVLEVLQRGSAMKNEHIRYLRQAFSDPLKDAPDDGYYYWERPRPQPSYVQPAYPTQHIPPMIWPEWNSTLP
ncbi:hypothetical protein BGZ68_001651 [Mortierella alpina]|nr:hypothetical protein BGZ68_001651 [Mortierella alpina]